MATDQKNLFGGEPLSPREKGLLDENMKLKEELRPYRRGEKSWLFWISALTILGIGAAATYFSYGGLC